MVLVLDNFLLELSKNPHVIEVLDIAVKIEQEFLIGFNIGLKDSYIASKIDEDDGCWRMNISLPFGKVYAKAMDKKLNEIVIMTSPGEIFLDNSVEISDEMKKTLLAQVKRTYNLDLSSKQSIKAFKEDVKEDVMVKYIFNAGDLDNAAEKVLGFIRNYRQNYNNYFKTYSFLWKDTEYNNATTLKKAMDALHEQD